MILKYVRITSIIILNDIDVNVIQYVHVMRICFMNLYFK